MENSKKIFARIQMLHKELQTLDGVEKRPADNEQPPISDAFDALITDAVLNTKVKKLFQDGHHARAVEEAYKYFDNLVLQLSSQQNLTGSSLMKTVFSPKNPILRLNAGKSSSEQNEQLGYMEICSGVMTGIRNPRAHDSDWEDTEERALQLLAFANHLVCKVKTAVTQDDE